MAKIILSFLCSTIIVLSSYTPLHTNHTQKLRTIVIDAGHGGKDPGCLGSKSKEAEVALETALELGRILKENIPDVKIIYTRSTNRFVELYERAKIANKNAADLFISIHCNSGPSAARGTETFVMGAHKEEQSLEVAKKENSAILFEADYQANYDGFDPNSDEQYILLENLVSAHNNQSINLATKIQDQFETRVGLKSRGVKQAGLLVLWRSAMPSVLVEIGFLSNKKDEEYLNKESNRVYVASAIYRAVKEYKGELESGNN